MAGNGNGSIICWIDEETTGLPHSPHTEIFEIHMIRTAPIRGEHEKTIWLPVDISKADPGALRINHYYSRRAEGYRKYGMEPKVAAEVIAEWTEGCTIGGNNVGMFDVPLAGALLQRHGLTPAWNYRVLEAVDYAAGVLGLPYPWTSRGVSEALGVPEPTGDEAHTAPADCRWAKRIYEEALKIASQQGRESRIKSSLVTILKKEYEGETEDKLVETAGRWANQIAQAPIAQKASA